MGTRGLQKGWTRSQGSGTPSSSQQTLVLALPAHGRGVSLLLLFPSAPRGDDERFGCSGLCPSEPCAKRERGEALVLLSRKPSSEFNPFPLAPTVKGFAQCPLLACAGCSGLPPPVCTGESKGPCAGVKKKWVLPSHGTYSEALWFSCCPALPATQGCCVCVTVFDPGRGDAP